MITKLLGNIKPGEIFEMERDLKYTWSFCKGHQVPSPQENSSKDFYLMLVGGTFVNLRIFTHHHAAGIDHMYRMVNIGGLSIHNLYDAHQVIGCPDISNDSARDALPLTRR